MIPEPLNPRTAPEPDDGVAFAPSSAGLIVGVGVDVVDIVRLTDAMARTPALVARLLTPGERGLSGASRAARVAAKEAVGKALGRPGDFSWQDVTVERTADGRPYLVLRGATLECARALGVVRLHLSLSHDGGVATAVVVAERDPRADAPRRAACAEDDGGQLDADALTRRP